jgi:hypothetical protein
VEKLFLQNAVPVSNFIYASVLNQSESHKLNRTRLRNTCNQSCNTVPYSSYRRCNKLIHFPKDYLHCQFSEIYGRFQKKIWGTGITRTWGSCSLMCILAAFTTGLWTRLGALPVSDEGSVGISSPSVQVPSHVCMCKLCMSTGTGSVSLKSPIVPRKNWLWKCWSAF